MEKQKEQLENIETTHKEQLEKMEKQLEATIAKIMEEMKQSCMHNPLPSTSSSSSPSYN